MTMFLADANLDIPWPVTSHWMQGLIGFMVIAVLALTLVKLCKSVFGRKPPLSEEIVKLEKRMAGVVMHQKNSALKEMGNRHRALQERVEKTEKHIETIQVERAATLEKINNRFDRVLTGIATIAGKLDIKLPN